MLTLATLFALMPDWLDPEKLIRSGGYILLFAIVFAESGLLIGFFLPGDSLLFIAGMAAAGAFQSGADSIHFNIWVVLIGVFIAGSNVRIPAHYHGCIVGLTLARKGTVVRLLPAFGYAAPAGRLAVAQPWVYAAGQLMHIVGLVWSGGYGVQRKVAGAEQVLRTPGEIAGMGLMGLGGAVAIVGGLLFLVVVLRAMRGVRVAAGVPA